MEFPRRPRRKTRENIVPLINIVFLLLIFFLLAGTLRPPDLWEITPPQMERGQAPEIPRVEILLRKDGRIAVNQTPVELQVLAPLLKKDHAPLKELEVQLKADAEVTARHLLPVLETLREAGVEELEVVTEVKL